MQLTVANVTSVTGATLDETAAENIWIPAVIQEIQGRCNRTFTGDDAWQDAGSHNNWVRGVTPDGVIDGINTIFTLPDTPDPNNIYVWRDGQLVYNEEDYTLTNRQLEFVVAPQAGSKKALVVDYLPLGLADDEETVSVPELPPDLGVAACWRTVVLAQDNPLSRLAGQNESSVKSETTGALKVEYFDNGLSVRDQILSEWAQILKRYRKPAICDSSPTSSTSMALS